MEQIRHHCHVAFRRQVVSHCFIKLVEAADVEGDNHSRMGTGNAGYAGVHLHVLAINLEGVGKGCISWHLPYAILLGPGGPSQGF